MHPAPVETIVSYRNGKRTADVERVSDKRQPFRVVYRYDGRVLPPSYHEKEDDARYKAARYVDQTFTTY